MAAVEQASSLSWPCLGLEFEVACPGREFQVALQAEEFQVALPQAGVSGGRS